MKEKMTFNHIAITLSALGAVALVTPEAGAASPIRVSAREVAHAIELGDNDKNQPKEGDKDKGKDKDEHKSKDKGSDKNRTAKSKKDKHGAKGGCGAGTCG
jgi:hypothetical protein